MRAYTSARGFGKSAVANRQGNRIGIQRNRFAQGSQSKQRVQRSLVWGKAPRFSDFPGFELCSPALPRTHDTNYFEYIIEGQQTVGKKRFGKGDVRLVHGGTGYGPIAVGSEGCTVLIVFADGSRAITELLPRNKTAAAESSR